MGGGSGYRDDKGALLAQVDALRRDLARAEASEADHERTRAELETKLRQLEKRVPAEAREAPPRRPLLTIALAVVTAAAVGGATYVILLDGGEASPPSSWFQLARPHCNPLEVTVWVKGHPPPPGPGGAAEKAVCLGLAGKIDEARATIDPLGGRDRTRAAQVLFETAHPIADAGDDPAAGPLMELVLRYWPENFQALYHAGMSAYAAGDHAHARARLTDFLARYKADDHFGRTARETLAKLPDQDSTHTP